MIGPAASWDWRGFECYYNCSCFHFHRRQELFVATINTSALYIYILAFATVKSAEAYDLSADGKSLHCGERGGETHETYFIICHQFSFRSVETKRRLYCQAALAVPVAGANWEWTRGERHVIVSLHRGYPLRNSGVKHGIQWIGVRDEYIILMPACAQTPRPGTRGFHWLGQQVPDAMLGWGSWVIQIWFNGSFPVTPFFFLNMPTINRNYSPAVVFSIFNISLFSPEDLNIKLTIVLLSTLYCEVDWNGGLDPNNIREAMYLRLGWGRYKMNLNLRI